MAPLPRMRYLVDTSGHTVRVALPEAFVLVDMTGEQEAKGRMPDALTDDALRSDAVATEPSVHTVSTFADDDTSPPVSQPEVTVSTDSG